MQAPQTSSKSNKYHSLLSAHLVWKPLATTRYILPPHIRWTSLSMTRKYWTVTLRNVRAFDTLSMVLIHMSNDRHHNYIIAVVMQHQSCRVLRAARDPPSQPGDTEATHRFAVFVPQIASRVHSQDDHKQTIFQGGNCILIFQTMQTAKELHLRSGGKLQNF